MNVATNLSKNVSGDGFTITSSTGTDVALTLADTNNWGLMSDEMFDKLDGIEASADITDTANVAAAGALMTSDHGISAGNTVKIHSDGASSGNYAIFGDDGIKGGTVGQLKSDIGSNTDAWEILSNVKLSSSSSGISPTLELSNTQTTSTTKGQINFVKDVATVDGEDIGGISFKAKDASGNTSQVFCDISGQVKESSNGLEGGELIFSVATHDGEIQPGLKISDGNAEDEIDVTLGNGANSLVTLPGSILFSSSTGGYLKFHDGSGEVTMTHTSNQILFNGSYSTETCHLKCDGDITAFSSSDRRLKKNIKRLVSPLEKLSKISGYSFEWNQQGEEKTNNYGKDIGVIAQEVEEILPDIINTRKDGYKGVNYEKIIPLLIESIKEQQSMIEELRGQIDELKTKII